MKRYAHLLCVSMIPLFLYSYAHAQLVTDTTRLSDSIWTMKKKKMVLDFMDLSEAEKASFWPLYESYCQAIRFIEMESLEIMDIFSRDAHSLKPKEVDHYSKKILLNDLLLAKVRRQYYRKFSRALSPVSAARFMEFDDAMRTAIHLEVRSNNEKDNLTKASLR